jgi:ubiquitin carboxyl-terminal hydrolase L5
MRCPPSAISLDGLELPRTAEDAYHFIVYLPVPGFVYELDATVDGHRMRRLGCPSTPPSLVPSCKALNTLRGVIEARIATYYTIHLAQFATPSFLACGGSLRILLEFNLVALRDDTMPTLYAQPSSAQASGDSVWEGFADLRAHSRLIFFANILTYRQPPSRSRIFFAVTIMLG